MLIAVQGLTPPIPLHSLGVENGYLPLLLPKTHTHTYTHRLSLQGLEPEILLLQSPEH